MKRISQLQVGDDVWIHSITKSYKPTPCCLSVDVSVHGTVILRKTLPNNGISFTFKSDNGRTHNSVLHNCCTKFIMCHTLFGSFVVTTEPIESKDDFNAKACYQDNSYVKDYIRRKKT